MKQKTKSWQNDFRILLAGVVANVDDWKSIEALEKFIKSLLHQERKRARKNEYNISMMIETSLGYIEMGKKEKAIYHLEIAQEMLRPLSILKGNKK